MSLPVRYRRVAQTELDEAVNWMMAQNPGWARRFEAAVAAVIAVIGANPYLHAEVQAGVREAPVAGCRYSLFYRVLPTRVEVFCVFHTARDPAVWQARA